MLELSKIHNLRREYISKQFRRSNLTKNPMHLFSKWLYEAYCQIPDPNAMCLSTVDHTGQPFQRLVLLKYFNDKTIVFFTHLNSRKAIHINNNPKISLCFPWNIINRQIIITGSVYKISKKEAQKYFYTRPKNNQISTWASKQSTIISSKKVLKNKFLKLKKKYFQKSVPFPHFWVGYKININSMEFWQGGIYRLHDRFLYKKNKKKWYINRLSP
ncbi:pyridoxamine 5'-phosphate oxidase [Candidatus Blochmanniella floridana]|uniref:Pyridoxine/pyridoxamine 5'-phosphate oxidase n=1 Tax=Blochmanniella floridana TaxID=203907 RepID=PDXH_BLOFL|nr:RecName: Full=Pyridoxine/pyridoxamine 5'-phosphate oxidase; AltName: Full=PNP/PMP oxidase; Short=PNPOx; AltName: Full=Pyridoxal 5'-phosphate synthase [Candidatus Blochmannia floridanus]CAD83436.1 pyridoxamine 5'-phosphate oxidase [Candidatus Blochmannia floridanus]